MADRSRPARFKRRPRTSEYAPARRDHVIRHRRRGRGGRYWIGSAADYRVGPGRVQVEDVHQWLAALAVAVDADPGMRADGRRTRLAVAAAVAEVHWSTTTGLAIAGHALLARRVEAGTGQRVGRSTVGNHIRALVEAGWLAVAEQGCSARITGDRDHASIYILTAPVEVLEPAWSEDDAADLAAGLAHLDGHHPDRGSDLGTLSSDSGRSFTAKIPTTPIRREHPERYVPRVKRERELAAEWMLGLYGWDYRLCAAYGWTQDLGRSLGKHWRAGRTPEQLVAVLAADGGLRPCDGVDNPCKVIMARLKAWQRKGQPWPPRREASAPRRGPRRPHLVMSGSAALPTPARTRPPSDAVALFAASGFRAGGLR